MVPESWRRAWFIRVPDVSVSLLLGPCICHPSQNPGVEEKQEFREEVCPSEPQIDIDRLALCWYKKHSKQKCRDTEKSVSCFTTVKSKTEKVFLGGLLHVALDVSSGGSSQQIEGLVQLLCNCGVQSIFSRRCAAVSLGNGPNSTWPDLTHQSVLYNRSSWKIHLHLLASNQKRFLWGKWWLKKGPEFL